MEKYRRDAQIEGRNQEMDKAGKCESAPSLLVSPMPIF